MKRDWKVYQEKLGTWAEAFKPFYDIGGMDKITDALQERAKGGHKIVPDSSNTYRAFLATPIQRIKVAVMGLCPYHTAINGVAVADGLALSCSNTMICQPSLEQWYNAIEKEFDDGLCLKCDRNPDLSYLANQGVLLTNISLTTELYKVGRHQDIWAPFTEFFVDRVLGFMSDIPVIFLGKEAEKYYGYLAPFQWSFCISHPASASYKGDVWDSEGVFKKVNQILKDQKKEGIQWIQTISEELKKS